MKHPLRRFVVLGALLFAGDALLGGGPVTAPPPLPAGADDQAVLFAAALERGYEHTDEVVRRRLVRNMRFALGDAAKGRSDDSLVAEAIRLHMHETDLVVRRRLAQKMTLLAYERARAQEPSEAELQAYLEAHAARFTEPARVRMVQIHFRSRARALAAAAHLPAPDHADGTGDPLPLPTELPPHSEAELAASFGPDLAAAALKAPLGRWSGPFRSAYGWHWIYVRERTPARVSPLATVRSEVREALLAERGDRELRRELAKLRRHFGLTQTADAGAPQTQEGGR